MGLVEMAAHDQNDGLLAQMVAMLLVIRGEATLGPLRRGMSGALTISAFRDCAPLQWPLSASRLQAF